jgi:hypothetical protein
MEKLVDILAAWVAIHGRGILGRVQIVACYQRFVCLVDRPVVHGVVLGCPFISCATGHNG